MKRVETGHLSNDYFPQDLFARLVIMVLHEPEQHRSKTTCDQELTENVQILTSVRVQNALF